MKLRFNKDVRNSVAEEPKKISTYGGLGLGVLGYSSNNAAIVFGAFAWWIICQTIAHLLLSIEDIDMSIETAVFSGMGLIVLWGLVMLWIAANSAHKSRSVNTPEDLSHS